MYTKLDLYLELYRNIFIISYLKERYFKNMETRKLRKEKSICNGCNEYSAAYDKCLVNLWSSVKYKGKRFTCPCTNCLVKGICLSACEDYQKYLQVSLKHIEGVINRLNENRK